MGAYDSLKSLVRQYIKTNGQNEITGQILQNVLIAMIDDLGITIDPTPTKNSTDAVASGGAFDMIQDATNVNATLSEDGKIYHNYLAGDIYYTVQDTGVRVYWVALADGEASEENPVTISELNFYHAENATDAVRMSLSIKTVTIDAYTKQESDAKYQPKGNYQPAGDYATEQQLAGKANVSDVYTKSETYNKTELNNMITTPNQEYVTVTATAQTTDVTDLLPVSGAADTIYRVGCWDGTQYANEYYSEYAWDGEKYNFLSRKVSDIVDQTYVEKEEYLYILADKLKYLLDTIDKNGNRKIYTPVEMETGAKVNGALKIEKVLFGDILRKQDNSEEWFEKTTDSQGKIIEGIRRDGSKVIANYPEMKDAQRRIVALEAIQDPSTISVTVDINGHGDFTSILRAIKYMADNDKKGDIIIKAGDYDVCAEYRDYNGQTYFEDYTGIYYRGGDDMGYYLRPGMNLIGEGTVRLIYNYDGNNEYVHQSFSIINTTCNNIVSNLTLITVTNDKCRYLIHDDYAQDSASMTGTNIFKNIIFKGYTHFGTSMGCGMGIANTYIIEDCYFMQDSSNTCISYHNSATSNVAENRLYITGCKGYGKCVVLTVGPSTRITPCVVSNCEFREIVKEMHYMGGEDNMELIKFNNTETGNN